MVEGFIWIDKIENKFKESLNGPETKKKHREALGRTPKEIEDVKKSVDNKEKAGEEAGAYEEVSNFFKAKAVEPTTEETEAGDQYTKDLLNADSALSKNR